MSKILETSRKWVSNPLVFVKIDLVFRSEFQQYWFAFSYHSSVNVIHIRESKASWKRLCLKVIELESNEHELV